MRALHPVDAVGYCVLEIREEGQARASPREERHRRHLRSCRLLMRAARLLGKGGDGRGISVYNSFIFPLSSVS